VIRIIVGAKTGEVMTRSVKHPALG